MSAAKHTPGLVAAAEALATAWNSNDDRAGALPPIELTKGERLYLAEAAVNASAAPDLLEALEELRRDTSRAENFARADAAIAKARGE